MIKKILIANRGEIAARVIRTCTNMDIESVAIYSEADKDAPYVSMATEAYEVGPARAQESYLHMDRIFSVAKKAQVDAIHPGYGFFSEHPGFARRCEEEGFTFIGPTSQIIALMGDKIKARQTMKEAGVPIIPGTEEAIHSIEQALQAAESIGYPVMVKASAGGGGVGMEIVHSDEELEKAIETNEQRAKSLFGDGSLFIEKHIENARHIEIQIAADTFGNIIHLYDRECSIQRRNQKVIEEAPSSLPGAVREEMAQTSVRACKQIGYTNIGTIEYLVDEQNNYYFLEMNTRIQVEHPVTEEITNVDLVELQIKIAEGEKLGLTQDDIQMNGHAIEVRIYAEDPETFFPSPGLITTCHVPKGEGIRQEMSVEANSVVTPFYDPMIGKLIVTNETRDEAVAHLTSVLDETMIEGIKTNVPMLQKLVQQQPFVDGDITINYIAQYIQVSPKK